MLFVDVADFFYSFLIFELPWDSTSKDLGSVNKPNGAVVIFGELGSHLEDFVAVHLLHVVAHLVTLLQAVLLVVTSLNHLDLFAQRAVVVFYVWLVRHRQRCEEINCDGFSRALF